MAMATKVPRSAGRRTLAYAFVLAWPIGCGVSSLARPADAPRARAAVAAPTSARAVWPVDRRIALAEVERLPEGIRRPEVVERIGGGVPGEGSIVWYRGAGESEYAFWFFPADMKNQDKWADQNMQLQWVTNGIEGRIVWPISSRGQDSQVALEKLMARAAEAALDRH